ncbi:MAG: alpha/beta hydrolase [Chloroflexales bacterium]
MNIPALQYIELPTGRLAYRVGGEGPPLLLIHGWGGSSRHWLAAYVTLTEGHTVYAIDMPGYGESPPGANGSGLRGLSLAVLAFIDTLNCGSVSLCGHSLGGAVALMVAASRPNQVERVALVSFGIARSDEEETRYRDLGTQMGTAAAFWAPWLALSRPWLALSRPWRQLAWSTPPLPTLLAGPMLHHLPDAPLLALGIADLAAMDALSSIEGAASTGDPLLTQAIRRTTMPTLVLGGREDPIFPPSSATALAAALADTHVVIINECGHVPMVEQPAVCYATLGEFFG